MKKTRKQIGSLFLTLCLVFIMMPLPVFAAELPETSVFSTITVSPSSAKAGETVTVTATVKEEYASEISALILSVYASDGYGMDNASEVSMTRQGDTNTYQKEFIVPDTAAIGDCTVCIEWDVSASADFRDYLTLTGNGGDDTNETDPPVIGTPIVSPATASPGDTVTVSVHVTDASAISTVEIYRLSLPGYTYILGGEIMNFQIGSGDWQYTFTIPANALNGSYDLVILAFDEYMNRAEKTVTGALTITNGGTDFDGPVIGDALMVTPTSAAKDETVRVSATITDASALKSVSFKVLDQNNANVSLGDMTRQGDTDIYQGTFTVPIRGISYGAYGVCDIIISTADYYENITERTFEDAITLTDESGGTDTTKPTVSDFRAERTGEKSIRFFFTPSTTGNYGYSILKKGASAPTDIETLLEIDSANEGDIDLSSYSFTDEDILVIYLQIENAVGVKSEIYSLEVPTYTLPINAQPPSITAQPISATYVQNETAISLFVLAKKTDGGSLSYQWYSNTTNSTVGGTEVGTNSYTYTPSTTTVGTTYYYCVVTNTNNEATTNKTAFTDSNTAVVTVKSPSSGGSNNGGSGYNGNGDGSSTVESNITVTTLPPTTENPNPPTKVTVTVTPTVLGDTVNTAIDSNTINDAIDKAQNIARKNDTTANCIVVEIKVDTKNTNAENINSNLLKESIDALVKTGAKELRITSEIAHISLNLDTLNEIKKQVGANVNVTMKKVDNSAISEEAQKIVGARPIYDFSITGTNGKELTDFGKGKVSVSIPYTLGANENAANVVAYYIDSKGNVQEMLNSVYDTVTQTLSFVTDHFSKFAVGYKNVIVSFTDTTNHWAKDSIEFIAARGILIGTGNGKFAPNDAMTRGMFVTALGRLAEASVSSYKQSSFSDVTADSYYLGYVEWANKNNIVNGIGSGKFAPNQAISSEQMAVIIANYAKVIGFNLPKVHTENTFTDHSKISAWAKDSVKSVQMAGIISGKDGNIFDPKGTSTRSEVSEVLKRFVELSISSDTAEGWTLKDGGK